MEEKCLRSWVQAPAAPKPPAIPGPELQGTSARAGSTDSLDLSTEGKRGARALRR